MAEPLTIRCRENGPLILPAAVKILDHLGNEFPLPTGKENIALCRCGQSRNKPFCDGSHRHAGFQAAETAVTEEIGRSKSRIAKFETDPKGEETVLSFFFF